jgi:hypothetical protein
MSDIDTISNELRAIAAGIDQAQNNAAAADSQAQEIAARTATSGFTGIVAGMSRIRDAITEVRARLTAASGSVAEAAAPVAAAPKQPSPQETITVLASATEKVTAARDGIVTALAKVDETQQLTAAILQGGQPGPMLAALETVKQVLIQVAQRCAAAAQHASAAISAARQAGGQGN